MSGPFAKVKINFTGEKPKYADVAGDFETAKVNLKNLMDMILDPKLPIEGGFTEDGIKIRHGIFGVSKTHPDGDHSLTAAYSIVMRSLQNSLQVQGSRSRIGQSSRRRPKQHSQTLLKHTSSAPRQSTISQDSWSDLRCTSGDSEEQSLSSSLLSAATSLQAKTPSVLISHICVLL